MNTVCKRILFTIIIVLIVIGLTTCKKEKIDPPSVKVFEGAITIETNKASVSAEVTDQGGAEVKSKGFVYGLSGGSLDTVFCGSGTGVYSAELNNLQPNTTYVYEAFAKNVGGFGTSGKVTFTTKPLPSFTIDVSANPSDGGRVSGGGSFQEGQYCTVIATANDGYTFTNWTENDNEVSADANYTFIVNGDRTLKANFTVQLLDEYIISISANPNNGGTVSGGGLYLEGQSCTISATANDGYAFTNWTENGNEVSTDANYTFNVNSSRTLVANFTILPPNSYAINVSSNPSDGGTVNGGGTYHQGQSCEVRATANTGFSFVNWTENGNEVSTNALYTFVVSSSRTLTANFTTQISNNYIVNVSANPTNGGTVTGSGTYQQGQDCTVTATSNEGYNFINWTENGIEVSSRTSYTFPVNSNRTLVANFATQQSNVYTIDVSANPTEGGTVNGGGTYQQGQQCTVTAAVNDGYTFANWTENGNVVSINASYTFIVNNDRILVANFIVQPQGAINGLFTINANGDRVFFSKGNLQYIGSASTPYWKFADNQWDYLSSMTGQNSTNQNVDRDLFGWGTSGWNNGNVYYQPWDSQNNGNGNQGFGYGPTDGTNYSYSLTDEYSHADWGIHNPISNTTGQWRTLTGEWTSGEWYYVFNIRNASTVNGVENARFAKACVNSVHGVILFPDSYMHPFGVAQPKGINETGNSGWDGNNYNTADFESMQDNGAVFLPAAGKREGTSLNDVGSCGYYWSVSINSNQSYDASGINFLNNGIDLYTIYRYNGLSVRLICPVN